jgi:hypothetical protein
MHRPRLTNRAERKRSPSGRLAAGLALCVLFTGLRASDAAPALVPGEASASSTAAGSSPAGAIAGNRFSIEPRCVWKGSPNSKTWWWQVHFPKVRNLAAILQVNGDRPSILSNAARRYVWQWSEDGQSWQDLKETETPCERRLFRLHRLAGLCRAAYLRIMVNESLGEAPALREVEFYDQDAGGIQFPDWIVAVSTTTENRTLPGGTAAFVDLARKCPGWESVLAQQIWLGDFDESFAAAEPHPVCAFLTGNSVEWCRQAREPWRGVQEVLAKRNLPIWAACGGAQALAILQETGVDKPWDCPRCRDPNHPKSPVYSHIGHTAQGNCGEYRTNIWERGKHNVQLVARDPAFQGLPEVFEIMENHVGQIAYVPQGWVRVATRGPGAFTENQCLRIADRYIYAAQFHIEKAGTPENSQRIMSNFLSLAKAWGGYNPKGKPVAPPDAAQ